MKYNVDETDLSLVADAIRTKGGTSSALLFPSGFVNAIQNIPSSNPTLIEKSITSNGAYIAENDNADGYSKVTVNVGVPIVIGSFTGLVTEKGSSKSITLPYTGSGYPIAMLIYPTAGAYKSGSDFYTTVQRYASAGYFYAKSDMSLTPDYSSNDIKNCGMACSIYKSSDSDATLYTRNSYMDDTILRNQNVTASSVDYVRFHSATDLKVFIADTSYGFMAGTEYTYIIYYSS